ncbi:MAG: histidine kinase [Prevotellaceae bacterium]|jgi:sensor histidine kinase YesM|nr:histidine kinase [Prevotellaceae bacterium]
MKRRTVKHISIIAVMGLIACGQTFWLLAWEKSAIVPLAVMAALLTLDYYLATLLNIRVLIPRLLLRNRYVAYIFSILGFVAIAGGLDLFPEYLLANRYHTQPGEHWYLSQGNRIFFVLSVIISYFISFVGTGIIFFLHLWNRSGRRLDDLQKQTARNELETVRTQIDSAALFDTLDRAADRVAQFPSEVSALLMDLSKSLRIQLYESRQKQHEPQEIPVQTYNLSSPALNFLTEKRYRVWRHLLMIIWFTLIILHHFNGTLSSLLFALGIPLMIWLAMIYFNIYVLIPKLMMRGKKMAYFAAISLLFLIVISLSVLFRMENIDVMENVSPWFPAFFIMSNAVKLSFPIFGVSAVCLFQYWVRNERHIVELETATLLSELEQLQNQVNPHFLFNMLNNIIVLTKTNLDEAATVLRKLSDMLQYQFHDFTGQSIRLGDDIHFLADYLKLEQLRRDNFEFSITADKGVEAIFLPPLLFIPFVENAVKHGNDSRQPSFVRLRFGLENNTFRFGCVNSKPLRQMRKEEVGGIGLPNVRRRLDLLYGDRHRLEISENDNIYSVTLTIRNDELS